ncbi:PH domain-containing protein [Pseudoxanthomonas composti]|uniref:Uncharacterized protein YyaB-like PH domain-containing protein n=1 Tax=Pseudoxanthomonas composti TaxID=2137479 RepID=A0A4Q1JQY7_9GAMM|nr:PH domain-containing protein [Pseudoxanthomonas composti]RXQ99680.1 hypothetical protein EPA99_17725 [Pseudoxanthomonas composti]
MQSRPYVSAVDGFIACCLALPLMLSAGTVAWGWLHGPSAGGLATFLGVLPALVLPLWLLLDTRYQLTAERLLVRCGPFRWRIALSEIRAVTPTRSLMSGPALSLDRLRVDYGRWRSVLISPRERQAFLDELAALREAQGTR